MANGKLVLHGRIHVCYPNGEIEDRTLSTEGGLKDYARAAATAVYELRKSLSLLRLLRTATRGCKRMESDQVRAAVNQLIDILEPDSMLGSHVIWTEKLFKNAEALPPLIAQEGTPSLQIVRKPHKPRPAPSSQAGQLIGGPVAPGADGS